MKMLASGTGCIARYSYSSWEMSRLKIRILVLGVLRVRRACSAMVRIVARVVRVLGV